MLKYVDMSPLTREEQLREAKRAQRLRERNAGLSTVQLRLPTARAAQLRAALKAPRFQQDFDQFLQDSVLDINQWPMLKDLAWNRHNQWVPAEEALGIYERNWRFVDVDKLEKGEAELIVRLKGRYGNGLLNV
jgi:hypothetical protein